MTITQLKNIILEAFVNVKLGNGISLKQAKVNNNYGRGVTTEEYSALPKTEITTNWRAIPIEDLEEYSYISHLDAEGFRYYIPAYMIASLEDHAAHKFFVSDIIFHLYPKRETESSWNYIMIQYSLLNAQQNEAVAIYLSELPNFLPIDADSTKEVTRALRNYWDSFFQS